MASNDVLVSFTGDGSQLISEIQRILGEFSKMTSAAKTGPKSSAILQISKELLSAEGQLGKELEANRARYEQIRDVLQQIETSKAKGVSLPFGTGKGTAVGSFGAVKGESRDDFQGRAEAEAAKIVGDLQVQAAEAASRHEAIRLQAIKTGTAAERERLGVVAQAATFQERVNHLLSDQRIGDAFRSREQSLQRQSDELARQALLLREQTLKSFDKKSGDHLRSKLAQTERQREGALLRQKAAENEISAIIGKITTQIQGAASEQKKLAQAALETAKAYGKNFSVDNLTVAGASSGDANALAAAQEKRARASRDLADAEARAEPTEALLRKKQETLGIAEAVDRTAAAQKRLVALQKELATTAGASQAVQSLIGLQVRLGTVTAELQRAKQGTKEYSKAAREQAQVVKEVEAELSRLAATRGTKGTEGNNEQQLSQALNRQTPLLNKVIGGALNDFQRRFVATLQFAVSGALIFGAQRLAKEFIQTAIEVERIFVDIASAFEFDTDAARGTSEFNRKLETLRRNILEVSLELNVLPTVANEAAFALVSRFKEPENALIALRAQLLATKVATIDQSEALRSLTAISEAFAAQIEVTTDNLSLQERILNRETLAAELQAKTLDQAVIIQQRWGVTVEDTVEGTARAAQVLSQLGFKAEETQALVAALSFAMGQTGSQAAEKLNRSLGQITSDKVKEELLAIARASSEFTLNASDFESGAQVYFKILEQIDRLQDVDPSAVTDIFQAVGQRRELETVANLFQTGDLQADIQRSFGDATDAAAQRFSYLDATVSETLSSIAARFEELASNLQQLGLITPLAALVTSLDILLSRFNTLLQIVIDLKQALDTLPGLPFTDGLGDTLITLGSILLIYRSIQKVLAAAIGLKAKGLIIDKAAVGLAKARFALTAPLAGRGARVVLAGGGASIPARATTTLGAKLGAVAGVAGIAAVAITGLVSAINDSQEAVREWNRQLKEDEQSLLAEVQKGPQEGESQREFERRIADLTRTQIRDRGAEPRDFGDVFFGGSIDKNLDFVNQLPQLDLVLAEKIVAELAEGISGLPDDLEGEDLFLANDYREILRREQAKLVTLSREGADPEVIEDTLSNLLRILEVFDSFTGRVETSREAEDAATVKSVQDRLSLLGDELQLGFIDPAAAMKVASSQIDLLEKRLAEPGADEEELNKAIRDGQKSYISTVGSILDERLAEAGQIKNDSVRIKAEVGAYQAAYDALVDEGLGNSREAQQYLRDMANAQVSLAESFTNQMRQLGQSFSGIARNLRERAKANELIIAAINQEINRLPFFDIIGKTLLTLEKVAIKRAEADAIYAEETKRQSEAYKAGLPAQSQLAQNGAELIRVERELANWTGDESGRLALVNEARQLRLDRQGIYLGRVKASLLLQAGVRNSTLELKAQITSVAKELELTAQAQGVQSEAYKSLKLSQLKLKAQLVDSQLELQDIQRRLDSDLTNSFEQAQLDMVEVLRRLQLPDLGELEREQLELERRNSEAAEQAAFFNDRMFQLKFLFETGELGTGAYIGALTTLLGQVDTTTQQGKEIFLQIQGLIDGLTGDISDLAFNVPGSIRLPTLFEVRRSLAADQLGVNYQDNRQMEINIDVDNAVEMGELVSILSTAIGDSITVDSARFAPGAAGITLGGFNG